jgi:PKD repeat protein
MRKILFTLTMALFGCGLFASPVTMESAQQVAVNFYKHYAVGATNCTVVDEYTGQYNGMTTYYVFIFKSGGFVMVAADDASTPILGYSTKNTFDKNNIPPNAQAWFDEYSKRISAIVSANVGNSKTIKEWKNIQDNQFDAAKSATDVSPMLSTTWDQSCYYNALCPYDASAPGGYCDHVPTGCVATATAQVMKYWNYPTTGVGSHTDLDTTFGHLTANFGATTYNWGSMANSVTSADTAVATLIYHCGIAVDMVYGASGSGAQETAIPNALVSYFSYQPNAEVQWQASFAADSNWLNMLETELNEGRPVLYAGDDGTEGHSFVFDGFETSPSVKFHVNWGWSGSEDGYFAVGALNPAPYAFNTNNCAVVRVSPKSNAPIASFTSNTTTPLVGGTVTFTDMSTNSPTSWLWTFEGGTPSTYNGQTPPAITYSGTAGYYEVILTVSNANGTDTKTSAQYVNVGGTASKWILENSGYATPSRGVSSISIVNPYIVWAGAIDGTVSTNNYTQDFTKTTNGGITWTADTIIFTGSTDYGIADLAAINDTICYAAMYPGVAANGGYIAKTINGGATWSIANSPSYSASWLDLLYFFDASNGVSVGDPNTSHVFGIYTTSDSGNTWTAVPSANIPVANASETGVVNQFCAFGSSTIWFGTQQGRIYKSVDKGLHWTVSSTGLGTTAQVTPVFRSDSVGVVTGSNYSTGAYLGMKITTDGGTTWNSITPTGYYVKSPNIANIPGTASMWVDVSAGYGHGSSFSNNDCSYFYDIDTGATQYTCVKFLDLNDGWAGGFNTSSTVGGIYKWDPSVITVGINPVKENPTQINIYPNPTSSYVNVEFSGITTRSIVNVYNLVGENIISKVVDPSYTNLLQLDFSTYKNGIYFVTVDTGKNIITKRVMLVK